MKKENGKNKNKYEPIQQKTKSEQQQSSQKH